MKRENTAEALVHQAVVATVEERGATVIKESKIEIGYMQIVEIV